MAGPKLDSTGTVKMKTLEEAGLAIQRINSTVEQYALAVKRNQPATAFQMNLRRQLPALAESLKSQFGMISDQITGVYIATSRGASDQVRVRALREGVAQIKQALEIAVAQTVTKHEVKD
jgi:hypothetical protein